MSERKLPFQSLPEAAKEHVYGAPVRTGIMGATRQLPFECPPLPVVQHVQQPVTYAAPAPVQHVQHVQQPVTYAAPVQTVQHVQQQMTYAAPQQAVTYAAPVQTVQHVQPQMTYAAPQQAVTYAAPMQQQYGSSMQLGSFY